MNKYVTKRVFHNACSFQAPHKVRIGMILLLLLSALLLCGYDEKGEKVYDGADLLTPDQEENLQEQAISLGKELSLDVVIVTTDDAEGKTAQEYADDFFDYNGFGYEDGEYSGILYLIDMDNRQSAISTTGTAIPRYSDREQDAWQDQLLGYLGDGDYYGACQEFLDGVKRYEAYPENGGSGTAPGTYPPGSNPPGGSGSYGGSVPAAGRGNSQELGKTLLVRLGISLAVAALIVGAMAFSARRMSGAGARSYQKGQVNVRRREDRFTHTTVVTRKIETNHNNRSGGGGSSVHTGSSGRSHGGSSRGF